MTASGVDVNMDGVSKVWQQPQIRSRHPKEYHPAPGVASAWCHAGLRQNVDGYANRSDVEASDTIVNANAKRQGGYSARPAASGLTCKTRGWQTFVGLWLPEGKHPAPGVAPAWRHADLCQDVDGGILPILRRPTP